MLCRQQRWIIPPSPWKGYFTVGVVHLWECEQSCFGVAAETYVSGCRKSMVLNIFDRSKRRIVNLIKIRIHAQFQHVKPLCQWHERVCADHWKVHTRIYLCGPTPDCLLTGFGYVACVAIGNRYDRNKTPSTACEYWGDRVMLLVKVLICVIYRPIKAQPVHGDGQKIVTWRTFFVRMREDFN